MMRASGIQTEISCRFSVSAEIVYCVFMNRLFPLLLIAAAFSGCLYTNIQAPRAYRAAAPSEVKSFPSDPTASGTSCFYSVLFMVAWGDGGYAAACREALKGSPDKVLYDVKSDVKQTSILLGLWSRTCTKIEGRVAQP